MLDEVHPRGGHLLRLPLLLFGETLQQLLVRLGEQGQRLAAPALLVNQTAPSPSVYDAARRIASAKRRATFTIQLLGNEHPLALSRVHHTPVYRRHRRERLKRPMRNHNGVDKADDLAEEVIAQPLRINENSEDADCALAHVDAAPVM